VFLPAPLHFSSCTPTFFKNTKIILYSFRYFQNSGSINKKYFQNKKFRRQKIISEHLSGNIFFFYFQIYKSGIHTTLWRRRSGNILERTIQKSFFKGGKIVFSESKGLQEEICRGAG